MKRRTNCCNCGAALPVSAPKCEFCGTRNIDLTMSDKFVIKDENYGTI